MRSRSAVIENRFLAAGGFLLCGLLAMLGSANTAQARATAASVVQIECGEKKGVGVAWKPGPKKQTHVVTTLHLVAGRPTCIIKNSRQKWTYAEISNVYYPADLALLKPMWNGTLTSDGLTPLEVGKLSNEQARYFQFLPNGRVQPKTISLDPNSVGTPLQNLDPRIRTKPEAFKKELCQKPKPYPDLDAKIYRLKKPVKPGDSGSPITQDGKIVGLIDGGYGKTKPAYWSIDGRQFASLATSKSQIPREGELCANQQKYLYSTDIPDQPKIHGVDLEPLYSTNFGEVYHDMDRDDQEGVVELAASMGLTLQQLKPNVIDIYQDAATGAIIALPRGFQIESEQDKELHETYIEIVNPTEDVGMILFVENDYDHDDAPAFIEYLSGETKSDWIEDQGAAECFADKYCERWFETQFSLDEGSEESNLGIAVIETSETDLLAMSVFFLSDHKKRAAADFIVISTCMYLADFAYY